MKKILTIVITFILIIFNGCQEIRNDNGIISSSSQEETDALSSKENSSITNATNKDIKHYNKKVNNDLIYDAVVSIPNINKIKIYDIEWQDFNLETTKKAFSISDDENLQIDKFFENYIHISDKKNNFDIGIDEYNLTYIKSSMYVDLLAYINLENLKKDYYVDLNVHENLQAIKTIQIITDILDNFTSLNLSIDDARIYYFDAEHLEKINEEAIKDLENIQNMEKYSTFNERRIEEIKIRKEYREYIRKQNHNCFVFDGHFAVDGVPIYSKRVAFDFLPIDIQTTNTIFPPKLKTIISDDGIELFSFNSNMFLKNITKEIEWENLIGFEKAIEIFEEQNNNLIAKTNVKSISLNYLTLPKSTIDGEYKLIPVWIFKGERSITNSQAKRFITFIDAVSGEYIV